MSCARSITVLPARVFLGILVLAISSYVWGYPVGFFLTILIGQFWAVSYFRSDERREKRLIGAIRKSMDGPGITQLNQTLSQQRQIRDLWWPYIACTLAAASLAIWRGPLLGLALFPLLGFLAWRILKRAKLFQKIESDVEKDLAADSH